MALPVLRDLDFIVEEPGNCSLQLTTGVMPWQMITGAVRLASDELLDMIHKIHFDNPSNQLIYAQPLNMCFKDFLVPNNDESFNTYRQRYFRTPSCPPKDDASFGSVPKAAQVFSIDLVEQVPRLPLKFQLYAQKGLRLGVTGYVMSNEFQLGIHYVDDMKVKSAALILAQSLYPTFRPANEASSKILKLP